MASSLSNVSFDLADLSFYRLKLWANLVFASGANALGLYLIICASPKHIRIYRWFLLDLLMTAFLLDFYFMAILQPFPLLPLAGYCTLGVLNLAGPFYGAMLGLLFLCFLLGACAAAALSAATYRLAAVYDLQHLVVSPRGLSIIVGSHLLITLPFQLLAAMVVTRVSNQELIRQKIYQETPGMRELLNSTEVCAFSPLDYSEEMKIALSEVIVEMSLVGLMGFLIVAAGFSSLFQMRHKLSAKVHQMHTQLSFALLCQLAVPGLLLFFPFFVVAVSIFLQAELKAISEFYAIIFSLHSTLNALVMIGFTRPYRNTVLRWLKALWRHARNVRSGAQRATATTGAATTAAAELATEFARGQKWSKQTKTVLKVAVVMRSMKQSPQRC